MLWVRATGVTAVLESPIGNDAGIGLREIGHSNFFAVKSDFRRFGTNFIGVHLTHFDGGFRAVVGGTLDATGRLRGIIVSKNAFHIRSDHKSCLGVGGSVVIKLEPARRICDIPAPRTEQEGRPARASRSAVHDIVLYDRTLVVAS